MIEKFLIWKKGIQHTHFHLKNFFLNQIVNIFTFTSSIISIITITLVIYLFCKHKHIRTIVVSLILHKTKEVEAKLTTETNNPECGTPYYWVVELCKILMAPQVIPTWRMPGDTLNSVTGHTDLILSGESSLSKI